MDPGSITLYGQNCLEAGLDPGTFFFKSGFFKQSKHVLLVSFDTRLVKRIHAQQGAVQAAVVVLEVLAHQELLELFLPVLRADFCLSETYSCRAEDAIASIPMVLIFLFTMRLFVKGLSSGAVKG